MKLFPKRRPAQLERQTAQAALVDAMGAVQEPSAPQPIHNPHGGTRWHRQDPDSADVRPVCNASGSAWAPGEGGLRECGLCPYMWEQRQAVAS